MKKLIVFIILFFITGCSLSDYQTLAQAAVSEHPASAFKLYADRKKNYYLRHPDILARDIKFFINNFNKEIKKFTFAISVWKNPKKPKKKTFVKYSYKYKARAVINFEKGTVRVETIAKNYKRVLHTALVNTMLMPDDPRSADLFSDKIKLNSKPFLAGEIYDFDHKAVLYRWRADRYAAWLIKHRLKSYIYKHQRVYYVSFNLVKNSQNIRVKKYLPYVETYSKKFKISKVLILSIIKTESDFNPYAVSYVPAFGLMQIVPTTAGVESYKKVYGYRHIPSREFLFIPKNNIHLGAAYLNILFYTYLNKIKNPLSREYCVVSAYNSGIGNVLRVFSPDRNKAYRIINSLSPAKVYRYLSMYLPSDEGRRYLAKVINNKKYFIGY